MRLYRAIVPSGAAAYLLLLAVIISGVAGVKHPYHAALATLALVAATIHAIIVIAVKRKAKSASKRGSD